MRIGLKEGVLKKISLVLIVAFSIVTLISIVPGCAGQKAANMPIVLLTDYGSEDYRIAQLKGIIYSNNPEAMVIDASHSVPAFDIAAGAFILDVAAREFPEKVVFICVIAPYTQPETKYLALTNNKNQIFVLPDNGLLTHVIKNTGVKTIYQVTDEKLFDQPMKRLVAERIQGKIGALIASGYRPQDLGIPLTTYRTLDIQDPVIAGHKLLGTIVYIDHYGNAVTNISGKTASEFGLKPGDTVNIISPQGKITARFGTIYSDVPQGKEVVFVVNNLGVVQLSINLGDFADVHGVKAGTKIEIQ
jgi:hypothetical protein